MSRRGRKSAKISLVPGNDPALCRYASLQAALEDALPILATMISNTATAPPLPNQTDDRDARICDARESGRTLASIGREFDISPQRVDQIVKQRKR